MIKQVETDRKIGNSQWFTQEKNTIVIDNPIRFTKKELSADNKVNYWTDRLQKREAKLAHGIESWSKKYGEDSSIWPESIKDKANWRQQLINSAKNRINIWQDVSQKAGEKLQNLVGNSANVCNEIIISQPEIDKVTKQRTGKKMFYSIKPHGPYGAPKVIENGAENGEIVGSVLPTIFMDPETSQIYVLTENDPDAKLQTGQDQRRAVRASKDNLINGYLINQIANNVNTDTNALVPGTVRETGINSLSNAARIVGFIKTGGVVIMQKPNEDLLNPSINPEDKVSLKAITIQDYASEPDNLGQGAVLKLIVDMMKRDEIKITANMPQARN